jgi:hypothetical protein
MAKVTDGLLAAAFPAGKQKGPKTKKVKSTRDTGEKAVSDQGQQISEQANSEETPRISTNKPKMMSHSSKAMLSPSYDSPKSGIASIAQNGKSKASMPPVESPREQVVRHAHAAKVRATRDWIDGNIDSKKHDQIHMRANKTLKSMGRHS